MFDSAAIRRIRTEAEGITGVRRQQGGGDRYGEAIGQDARVAVTAEDAIRNAHAWFEVNSGWAPPDEDTLADWEADGVCRCPDECLVAPDSWCQHGLASWTLIIAALEQP
jgi:hypothetical protein